MKKRLGCYVRHYRLRWGFSQDELAFLAGAKSRTAISYVEGQRRAPNLATAFALNLIFGANPAELFPRLAEEVEDGVMARAYDLYERLQGNPSKRTQAKLDFLEELFERAKLRNADESKTLVW